MKDFLSDFRRPLTALWSAVASFILVYALIVYGNDKATLNLILGTVSGSIVGGIFGFYFSDSVKKPEDKPQAVDTADKIVS